MDSLYSFLFGRSPDAATEIMHPELGQLVFEDEGWWKGSREIGNEVVHFFVNDDGNGLEEGLDLICIEALERFSEYDSMARSKIIDYVESWGAEPPTLFGPELCWFYQATDKRGFTLRLGEVGDSGRLWRVRFENAVIVDVGFED